MSNLYFRSEWLVRRLKREGWGTGGVLLYVAQTSMDMQCSLQMISYELWQTRKDVCKVFPFLWRVPSVRIRDYVCDLVKDFMRFENFQQISSEEFDAIPTGDLFEPLLNVGGVDFCLFIEEIAEQNEIILSAEENKSKE